MNTMIEFVTLLTVLIFWTAIFSGIAWLLLKIPSVMEFLERIFSNKQNSELTDALTSISPDEKP